MGQVLIIQNKIDDKSVNTIYYHWSAYTESSIAELDSFANSLSHKYHNRFDAFLSTLIETWKLFICRISTLLKILTFEGFGSV